MGGYVHIFDHYNTTSVLPYIYTWPDTVCTDVQEMTDIVRAIYDMMGKYTYPALKIDTPKQHVDAFFQVRNY